MRKSIVFVSFLFSYVFLGGAYADELGASDNLPPIFVRESKNTHPLWAVQKILETMKIKVVNEVNGDERGENGLRVQDWEWTPVNVTLTDRGDTHILRATFNFDDVLSSERLQYGDNGTAQDPADDGLVKKYNSDLAKEVVWIYTGKHPGDQLDSSYVKIGKTDVPLYHPTSGKSVFLRRSPRHHFEVTETNVVAGGVGSNGVNVIASIFNENVDVSVQDWSVMMTADTTPDAKGRVSSASFSVAHLEEDFENKRDGGQTFDRNRVLLSAGVYLALLKALTLNMELARHVEEGNADQVSESFSSVGLETDTNLLPLVGNVRVGLRTDRFLGVNSGDDRARAAVALRKKLAGAKWDVVVEYGENYLTGSLFDNESKQHYLDVGFRLNY